MSDLTIVLKGAAADKLRKLVADEHYARPEDAVADALNALDASDDPLFEPWLRDIAVKRSDALAADPSRALTPDQVRARLSQD